LSAVSTDRSGQAQIRSDGLGGLENLVGLAAVYGNITAMATSDLSRDERQRRDAHANDAARAETLRLDGARSLGENLEQADALIRAAFELAGGFSAGGS
jgi:hypothetical protein